MIIGELQSLFARHNVGAALSAKAVFKPTKEFPTARHTLYSAKENMEIDKVVPVAVSVKTKLGKSGSAEDYSPGLAETASGVAAGRERTGCARASEIEPRKGSPGFGLSSVLIGWAVSIPRFIEMISDPVMGNISDNFHSQRGCAGCLFLLSSRHAKFPLIGFPMHAGQCR